MYRGGVYAVPNDTFAVILAIVFSCKGIGSDDPLAVIKLDFFESVAVIE